MSDLDFISKETFEKKRTDPKVRLAPIRKAILEKLAEEFEKKRDADDITFSMMPTPGPENDIRIVVADINKIIQNEHGLVLRYKVERSGSRALRITCSEWYPPAPADDSFFALQMK